MKIEELKEKRQNIVERAAREENLYQMKLKEIEKLKLQLQSLQKVWAVKRKIINYIYICFVNMLTTHINHIRSHKKQAMDIERYEPAQLILEATFMKAPESTQFTEIYEKNADYDWVTTYATLLTYF